MWIADTVAGRDGTDFVSNVEKLSFRDANLVALDLANPLPVKDVLSQNSSGQALNRTQAHLLSATQLLGNDIDYQGNPLHITALSDAQGGTATLTAAGDVLFTPNANRPRELRHHRSRRRRRGQAPASAHRPTRSAIRHHAGREWAARGE